MRETCWNKALINTPSGFAGGGFNMQMAARSGAAHCRWGKGVGVLLCVLLLPCGFRGAFLRRFAVFAAHPCAAFGCVSSRVAASGGQGGPGGLRFPPRPSLDSPLPLETPPLRCGVGGGGARRSSAALCRWGKGHMCCSAFCRCVVAFAARSCAAFGCGSSLVAASGGQ